MQNRISNQYNASDFDRKSSPGISQKSRKRHYLNNKQQYESAQVDLRIAKNSSNLSSFISIVFEKDPFATKINNLRKKQETHLIQLSERNLQTEDDVSIDLNSAIQFEE